MPYAENARKIFDLVALYPLITGNDIANDCAVKSVAINPFANNCSGMSETSAIIANFADNGIDAPRHARKPD